MSGPPSLHSDTPANGPTPDVKFATYTPDTFTPTLPIIPSLVHLINAAFSRYFETFVVPRISSPGHLIADYSSPGSHFFVLYTDDDGGTQTPVATAALKPTSTPSVCKLELLCTLPSCTRRGYASRMLHHTETTARVNGYTRVTAFVVKELGVVPFYEKRDYYVVREDHWPDEDGGWGYTESWGAVRPFTLCTLEKRLGDAP